MHLTTIPTALVGLNQSKDAPISVPVTVRVSQFLNLWPPFEVSGNAARQAYIHPNDDFFQAGELFRRAMTDKDRDHLIGNITTHLCNAIKRIQLRQAAIFYKADTEYGTRVSEGLKLEVKQVKQLAEMSQEERVKTTAQ